MLCPKKNVSNIVNKYFENFSVEKSLWTVWDFMEAYSYLNHESEVEQLKDERTEVGVGLMRFLIELRECR